MSKVEFQNQQQVSVKNNQHLQQSQLRSLNIQKSLNDHLDFIEDIKKKGWKGEQLFSFNEKNSSNQNQTNNEGTLIGEIVFEKNVLCLASLISHHYLVSIRKSEIKYRPSQIKFQLLKDHKSYEVENYEQKEIENYYLIVFKLRLNLGEQLGFLGVITYLDKIYYEQYDLQNKKKTVCIPYHVQQQYITDIIDDTLVIMKNLSFKTCDNQQNEYFGTPVVANDPFIGSFIIGLVVKCGLTNYKAIILQQSHLQFMKRIITNTESIDEGNIVQQEERSVIKNITKLESRVIYQSNGDLAHKDGIYTLCRLNNSSLASSSVDKTIRIWDWRGQTLLNNLDCDGCCRYFVCEDNLLVGTSENYVIIIDWQSRKIDGVIPCKNKLYSLLIFKNKTIFAGDCYGNINIINNTNLMYYIRNHDENPKGHRGSVNVMHKINQIPNIFFTAGEFGEIKVWDSEKFELKGELIGHEKEKSVYYLESYSINGQKEQRHDDLHLKIYFLISGSSDKTIRIWNIHTFQQCRIIQLINPIYAACIINQSELVIGDGSCIKILNIHNQQESFIIEKHDCRVNAICKLSETSFASGDIEGSIITWSLKRPAILIQDGGDSSPSSSFQQENTYSQKQNQANLKQKQTQQDKSLKQDSEQSQQQQNAFNNSENNFDKSNIKQQNNNNNTNNNIHHRYEDKSLELVEKQNEEVSRNFKSNSNQFNTPYLGSLPFQKEQIQQVAPIQLNDNQFQNPYQEQINQNKSNGYQSNAKKMNNSIQPSSTTNQRQPPQQKLNVQFFKEDSLNQNVSNLKEVADKTNRAQPFQLNQVQDYKSAHYNDKSPQAYKKNVSQHNQPNYSTCDSKNLDFNFLQQQDKQLEAKQNIFKNLMSSNQNQQNFLCQKQNLPEMAMNIKDEGFSSNTNEQNPSQVAQNLIGKNNINGLNNTQASLECGFNNNLNSQDLLNQSKFQNSNSFVDLLKQFDDNDKYQIIHQKKLVVNISPHSKGLNNSNQSIQINGQNTYSKNQQRLPFYQTLNNEHKEQLEYYNMLIQQYQTQNQNQIQQQPKEKQSTETGLDKSQTKKPLSLDTESVEREYQVAQQKVNLDLQKIGVNPQQTLTPKSADFKTSQLRQKEIVLGFNLKEGDTSYMKNYNKNTTFSPINQSNIDELNDKDFKEEINRLNQNSEVSQQQKLLQKTLDESKEKDLVIQKLLKENKEMKEQLLAHNSSIEKYQNQIQQLIDTLQKSEEERIQIVNEIKQVTPQLSKYSDITKQLREKSENQIQIIKKQDEEIRDLKEYILYLQNQKERTKLEANGKQKKPEKVYDPQKQIIQQYKEVTEDKKNNLLSPLQKKLEYLHNDIQSEEQYKHFQKANNQIEVTDFSDYASQGHLYAYDKLDSYQKSALDSQSQQQKNEDKLNNKELIMIQLRILQQESLTLHKQIVSLKSKISECTNENEMIQLLNELQKIHSLYEMKNDEISEVKQLYNVF
ncbi:hypothetical protein ABPG72_008606 [Tetrahymena utriculariae]